MCLVYIVSCRVVPKQILWDSRRSKFDLFILIKYPEICSLLFLYKLEMDYIYFITE